MALKYSDRPQTLNGRRLSAAPTGPYVDWEKATIYSEGPRTTQRRAFPADAQPIQSAPQTSTPVLVYGQDGNGHWAIFHKEAWRKLEPQRDSYSGAVSWRMNGEQVAQPIAWLPRRKGG